MSEQITTGPHDPTRWQNLPKRYETLIQSSNTDEALERRTGDEPEREIGGKQDNPADDFERDNHWRHRNH